MVTTNCPGYKLSVYQYVVVTSLEASTHSNEASGIDFAAVVCCVSSVIEDLCCYCVMTRLIRSKGMTVLHSGVVYRWDTTFLL